MRLKALSIGVLAVALAAAPISSASAWPHFFHHGYGHWHGGGPVVGLFGLGAAVVVGAATIATAPIAIIANAASGPSYDQRGGYYAQPQGYYHQPPGYYGGYQGYPPPQAYYARPGYYGPPQGYAPPQAYYGPQRYAAPQGYGAPQGYAPPQGYNQPAPGYGAPPPGG